MTVKTVSLDEVLAEKMRDPEFKKGYEALTITYQALLHGRVIRGFDVLATNAGSARLLIEQRMRDERRFGLLRKWIADRELVQPVVSDGTIVPGGLTG